MIKNNIQIIGIIDIHGRVFSTMCTLKDPIFHNQLWPNVKKKWRCNNYIGIVESELSTHTITKKDFKNIKEHLKRKYDYEEKKK